MKTPVSNYRLAKALAAHGILAERSGNIVRVTSANRQDVTAEILLPESLPLEAKAISQLLAFAGVRHPDGGHVCKACATPDFHPGSKVPVGSVLVTSHDMVIPQAVGTEQLWDAPPRTRPDSRTVLIEEGPARRAAER